MIIGNGLLAQAFTELDTLDLLIFASGVSDSQCTDKSEYKREMDLLLNSISQFPSNKLIYFSTCDFYDSSKNSMYMEHKKEIENTIKDTSKRWIIFRLPQIIGKGNKKNLVQLLSKNIINDIKFDLYHDLERNLIDIDDVREIAKFYMNLENISINIANPENIKVKDIVNIIERITLKNAITTNVEGSHTFNIPMRSDFPTSYFSDDYYYIKIKKFINDNI